MSTTTALSSPEPRRSTCRPVENPAIYRLPIEETGFSEGKIGVDDRGRATFVIGSVIALEWREGEWLIGGSRRKGISTGEAIRIARALHEDRVRAMSLLRVAMGGRA